MEGRQQCLPYFCCKFLYVKLISRFIPGFIWWAITFWLFTLPGSKIPDIDLFHKLQVDKLVHIFLFVVLCFSFMFPFRYTGLSSKNKIRLFIALTLLFIGYGIAIEFIQRDYIENRSFDIGDIIADTVGCAIALVIALKRWLKG